MAEKDITRGRAFADTTGTAVGVVAVHINEAAKGFVEALRRELSEKGGGEMDPEFVGKTFDQVLQRSWPLIEEVNKEDRDRAGREAARARLKELPEEDQVIARHLPGLDTRRMSKTEKINLSKEILGDAGKVVYIGKRGVDYQTDEERDALERAVREKIKKDGW